MTTIFLSKQDNEILFEDFTNELKDEFSFSPTTQDLIDSFAEDGEWDTFEIDQLFGNWQSREFSDFLIQHGFAAEDFENLPVDMEISFIAPELSRVNALNTLENIAAFRIEEIQAAIVKLTSEPTLLTAEETKTLQSLPQKTRHPAILTFAYRELEAAGLHNLLNENWTDVKVYIQKFQPEPSHQERKINPDYENIKARIATLKTQKKKEDLLAIVKTADRNSYSGADLAIEALKELGLSQDELTSLYNHFQKEPMPYGVEITYAEILVASLPNDTTQAYLIDLLATKYIDSSETLVIAAQGLIDNGQAEVAKTTLIANLESLNQSKLSSDADPLFFSFQLSNYSDYINGALQALSCFTNDPSVKTFLIKVVTGNRLESFYSDYKLEAAKSLLAFEYDDAVRTAVLEASYICSNEDDFFELINTLPRHSDIKKHCLKVLDSKEHSDLWDQAIVTLKQYSFDEAAVIETLIEHTTYQNYVYMTSSFHAIQSLGHFPNSVRAHDFLLGLLNNENASSARRYYAATTLMKFEPNPQIQAAYLNGMNSEDDEISKNCIKGLALYAPNPTVKTALHEKFLNNTDEKSYSGSVWQYNFYIDDALIAFHGQLNPRDYLPLFEKITDSDMKIFMFFLERISIDFDALVYEGLQQNSTNPKQQRLILSAYRSSANNNVDHWVREFMNQPSINQTEQIKFLSLLSEPTTNDLQMLTQWFSENKRGHYLVEDTLEAWPKEISKTWAKEQYQSNNAKLGTSGFDGKLADMLIPWVE